VLGGKPKSRVGQPCPYCGVTMTQPVSKVRVTNCMTSATRDHIKPKAFGGGRRLANRIIVCKRCNEDKSDRFLTTWLYELRMKDDPRAVFVAAFLEKLMAQSIMELKKNIDQSGTEAV
jgi:5-methylcytosine-specific restriction endonuclease McrA